MKFDSKCYVSWLLLVLSATTAPSSNAFQSPAITVGPSKMLNHKFNTALYYDASGDPPNEGGTNNAWTILSTTEKWISGTLANVNEKPPSKSSASSSSSPSSSSSSSASNPYSRKELSYVCETSQDPAMIIANIFRKLKEFREKGEQHGHNQEASDDESKKTLRQTQLLVIPGNSDLSESFFVFDDMITAINQARRDARDYITDIAMEKLDDRLYADEDDDIDRDWVVSVNCAHLHPKFGEKRPEQILKEMKQQEADGEVDVNLEEYKKRRIAARQSPYPTVVVEVRATPPPDFSVSPSRTTLQSKTTSPADKQVSPEDIQRLEALFSKSAITEEEKNKTPSNDAFYSAISDHLEEISLVTPMILSQNWIAKHDDKFDISSCAFTASETKHVDEAYEFVFCNLAMQTSRFIPPKQGIAAKTAAIGNTSSTSGQPRHYLVMNNFLTSSATSLDKFAREAQNIINTIPVLKGNVEVTTFHPEHVDSVRRSPVPIVALQWKEQ